jgi:hypothetical protein
MPPRVPNCSGSARSHPATSGRSGTSFPGDSPYQTLALHWDGTSWSQVPTPSPGYNLDVLEAVSAISPTDVWAVGSYATTTGVYDTLILHWNGSAWSQLPSPSPAGTGKYAFSSLSAVTALSSSDAWAVGQYGHDVGQGVDAKTLVLHWNGTAWTQVASPSVGVHSGLLGVTALSGTNAWAVGGVYPNNHALVDKTLVLHWNGSTWTRS